VITIRVWEGTPEGAAELANTVERAYRQVLSEQTASGARQAVVALQRRQQQLGEEILELEAAGARRARRRDPDDGERGPPGRPDWHHRRGVRHHIGAAARSGHRLVDHDEFTRLAGTGLGSDQADSLSWCRIKRCRRSWTARSTWCRTCGRGYCSGTSRCA
jgi:hypothetical protein